MPFAESVRPRPQIAYFEAVADIDNNTARELTRLGGRYPSPLPRWEPVPRPSGHFLQGTRRV